VGCVCDLCERNRHFKPSVNDAAVAGLHVCIVYKPPKEGALQTFPFPVASAGICTTILASEREGASRNDFARLNRSPFIHTSLVFAFVSFRFVSFVLV